MAQVDGSLFADSNSHADDNPKLGEARCFYINWKKRVVKIGKQNEY